VPKTRRNERACARRPGVLWASGFMPAAILHDLHGT
jgi:hypothetical protein